MSAAAAAPAAPAAPLGDAAASTSATTRALIVVALGVLVIYFVMRAKPTETATPVEKE